MGNFGHHAAGSIASGAVVSAAAYYGLQSSVADAAAGGLLCALSGLIPDIDSPVSRPSDIIANFASVLAPIFILQSLDASEYSTSVLLIIAFTLYVAVRYGLRAVVSRMTAHRGMIHSIPSAIIWGAFVFLAFRRSPFMVKNIMAASAAIGFFVHLLIDEMFSLVDISGGKITPKSSSGTALKFFGHSTIANIFTYSLLAAVLYLCAKSSGFIGK